MASEWSPRLALSLVGYRWGPMLRRPLARLLRSPREQLCTPGIIFDTTTTGPCTEAAAAAATSATAARHASLAAWVDRLEPGLARVRVRVRVSYG